MLIKQLYALPADTMDLIEMRDGSLYTFLITPARKLTEKDLSPVASPLDSTSYLASAHADPYDGVLEKMQMRAFGLTKIPLVEIRNKKGYSASRLANESGVNIRQIQRIEIGESESGNMTARNLLAIADVLGVDPHTLL